MNCKVRRHCRAFDRVSADPKRQSDCDRCLAILEELSAKYLGE
jgi:hypothetical protein